MPADAPDEATAVTLRPDDILVLRALGLGDALTGVAALRGIRRRYPDRRLVLAGPAATGRLLRGLGVVDEVLPLPGLVPLPEFPPGTVAVNLHGRGPTSHRLLQQARPERQIAFAALEAGHDGPHWRAAEHEVDRWCRLVRHAGADCTREDLRLRPRAAADGQRRDRSGPGPVLVHPGAASASRHWPVERWRRVAAALAAGGHRVLVTGSAAEAGLGEAVAGGVAGVEDHTGVHDVEELSALVRDAGLVLSGDTGVAHLATGWAVPSVVLFGPVPPARWGPAIDADLHTVLWHGDPDAGTWGDPHGDTLDPLLEKITVDEVLEAARTQLHTVPTPTPAPERIHREP
ncbi:glycosyltransferase family 9 protein [Citricoccus sp. I39-566]|uniref:glycosyltransferase family 9 protein n=1 Tax=Citricoccus sp. I39-566 TaxID=3073268 RepID=UPI00286D5787|nr:glycosyltransferase family 9 protein [Citricoccus sp. I39-566]WMY77349.1 glycosyltransferase family 9 protein [Citricoccus sp. I39-566]